MAIKIINTFLAIFLMICFSTTTSGKTTDSGETLPVFTTDIHGLLTSLLDTHKEIESFSHRLKSARALVRQSQGLYYPRLDLHGDAGLEKIQKETSIDTEEERYAITLRGTQLVTDFGRTTNIIARERVLLAQAKAKLDAIRQQTLRDGIIAYINIVKARDRLYIAEKSEIRIKELTGIEKALVEKGAGLTSDVLQAKSQLAGAMARQVAAKGDLEIARNRFHSVFAYYPSLDDIVVFQAVPFPDAFMPKALENAVAEALITNPELKITTFEVDSSRKKILISKSANFPTINLFAEARNAKDDDGLSGYREDYGAGVELSCNLFNGGSDQAAIQAALQNNAAASTHLAHARQLVTEQVRNSWEQLTTQTRRSELLEQQAAILKTFLELAKKERKMGNRSLLDVLNGEVNYLNAQGNAVAAREDTKIAAYNLMLAMGKIELDIFAR
ncbi:TolC family protein [Desulfobacter vibrioformis]|uniref:TolC family protein n=1 Tax=Desulfobacter vibrioformis TaxID=34031 RepID=UPI00055079F3|nr:TolC family protein [Desulfobacter vibrioformis]